jgi:hypothetical protein
MQFHEIRELYMEDALPRSIASARVLSLAVLNVGARFAGLGGHATS